MEMEELWYRGNFDLTCRANYGEALLSAEYPGGYREDAIIGSTNGLRSWSLTYAALTEALITPRDRQAETRLLYVWNFYRRSKGAGNRPFLVRCPLDNRLYIAVFTDNLIEMRMLRHRLATTGLDIEQVNVRGVATREDGSYADEIENTDVM